MKSLMAATIAVIVCCTSTVLLAQPPVQREAFGAPTRAGIPLQTNRMACLKDLGVTTFSNYISLANSLFDNNPFCCDMSSSDQLECIETNSLKTQGMIDYCRMMSTKCSRDTGLSTGYDLICNVEDYSQQTPLEKSASIFDCYLGILQSCSQTLNKICK